MLEYTKNSIYEKNMANYLFTWLCNLINIQKNLYFLDNDFNFYYDILNMYLNCSLISYQNIIRLNKFINKLWKLNVNIKSIVYTIESIYFKKRNFDIKSFFIRLFLFFLESWYLPKKNFIFFLSNLERLIFLINIILFIYIKIIYIFFKTK